MTIRKLVMVCVAAAAAVLVAREAAGFAVFLKRMQPWGEPALIAGRPVDLVFDCSKRLLAVLNWRGVLLLDPTTGSPLAEVKTRSTSYAGVGFRHGDRKLGPRRQRATARTVSS